MKLKQVLVIAIIAMFLLVPFASAKQEVADNDNIKQDKKTDEKVTDKTKEVAKEITSKDKDIKGKVTVTDSDSSKYTVEKKSKTEISISKAESKGEHTRSKVTFAKEDLQKIDIDGDQIYGVLHIADDGSTSHDIYTESQLVAGTEMIFSENIVNGYSGYWEKTQTGVTSGTTIDIPDVSGTDFYVTSSVTGTIPANVHVDSSNVSTYPSGLIGLWNLDTNVLDTSITKNNGTAYNITYSNGAAIFNGLSSGVRVSHIPAYNSSSVSIHVKMNSSGIQADNYAGIMQRFNSYALQYNGAGDGLLWTIRSGATNKDVAIASFAYQKPRDVFGICNGTYSTAYVNTTLKGTIATPSGIDASKNNLYIGSYGTTTSAPTGNYYKGTISSAELYNRALSISEIRQLYAGQTGISMRPVPSYNFTGYDIASGVEKIIDTDATCTGLEYIDTTGGTHTVTVRVYFTEDITKTTETKGAVYQNVSIIHTKQNATASVGTIAYELDPLYSGTPVLTSNNTNATVSRNDTHAIISTGLVKQGQSFSYAVSVPDNHDHIIFKNRLMQWMGSGWDYVGVAPDDWTDAIPDIGVTVS